MDETELSIANKANAQPVFLLGGAAALGETPVLPGRMVGITHSQHPWSNWVGGQCTPYAWEQTEQITKDESVCSVISFVFEHCGTRSIIYPENLLLLSLFIFSSQQAVPPLALCHLIKV